MAFRYENKKFVNKKCLFFYYLMLLNRLVGYREEKNLETVEIKQEIIQKFIPHFIPPLVHILEFVIIMEEFLDLNFHQTGTSF